jgi:adenine-specific DNA-methyltransferase
LCQIDEPIKKDKPAYQFCKDNDLEPVISSITIERLKRAGEKLKVESEKLKVKNEGNLGQLDFEENSVEEPSAAPLDTGFKVFDSVDSPRLALVEENPQNSPLEGWQPTADGVDTTQTNTQVELIIPQIDSLSRIYNIIFSVGLDEPSQIPETVLKDCIYKIGNNYYITNSEKISKEQLSEVIKSGRVFIDGWTASLNATLQNYKEDVKIVF